MTAPRILSVADAATKLGCSTAAVRRACQRGLLTATKCGRDWAILASDLADWSPRAYRRRTDPTQ